MFSASVFFYVLTFPRRLNLFGKSKVDSGAIMWHKPVDESSLVLCIVIFCVFELWAYVQGSCDMNDEAQTPLLFFSIMHLFIYDTKGKIR